MKIVQIISIFSLPALLTACVGLTFDDVFAPNFPNQQVQKTTSSTNRNEPATSTNKVNSNEIPLRREKPTKVVDSSKSTQDATSCLTSQLEKRFNLPADFYTVRNYKDGSATVQLVNPYTKKNGLYIDVVPKSANKSQLFLYANYATMSQAWKNLPEKCK